MKKFLPPFLVIAFSLAAGCVSIDDTKVQVLKPDDVDPWSRPVLQQCTPHPMPHQLIRATANEGYPFLHLGPQQISDQSGFDQVWTGLTILPDPSRPATADLKPSVDWTRQSGYMVSVASDDPCQRAEPYGDEMTTDCQNVTIGIYTWTESENCQQTAGSYPVFLYLYPKVNLPVFVQMVSPTPTFTPTVVPTSTATSTPTVTPTPVDGDGE